MRPGASRPASRKKLYTLAALALLGFPAALLGTASPAAAASVAVRKDLASLPPDGAGAAPYLNFGAQLGNEGVEGYSDMLLPLWANQDSILFFNPRLSLADAGQNDFSLGLGLRRMVIPGLVLGGNVFVDSFESKNNSRFNQWGLGLEFLTYMAIK